jgi:hypothetical protein
MNVVTAAPETGSPAVAGDIGLSFLDGEPTTIIDVIPVTVASDVPVAAPKSRGLVRILKQIANATTDLLYRVAGALFRAATRAYVTVKYHTCRITRAHLVYKPRHTIRRTWYARQRSTSQYNAARREQAKEGELCYPPEFISLLETFIETLRYEEDTLHPARTGRHFICS